MDLVDTDVLIDVQRGHPPALAWFGTLTGLPMVPGFVVMELVQDARNALEVQRALKLIAPLRVVWPTEADCSRALSDFTAYHLSHNDDSTPYAVGECEGPERQNPYERAGSWRRPSRCPDSLAINCWSRSCRAFDGRASRNGAP